VRRFVHIGSPSIYFRFADQYDIGEAFVPPTRWVTDYARSKWESELRVRDAAAHGMPSIVLRPRAVFGEGDRAILPRLLDVAARGWFPLVHGGRALIDITHVDNVAAAIADCIDADVACDGGAYNLTNGEPIRVRDLLTRLFDALDLRVRTIPVSRGIAVAMAGISERIANWRKDRPEPGLTRYGVGVIGYSQTLDIGRARRELGYSPQVSIVEGIAGFARSRGDHAAA
jgi:nucleoside-diphosphate-sugar epimerase